MGTSGKDSQIPRAHELRSTGSDPNQMTKLREFLAKELDLQDEDFQVITDYLKRRQLEVREKENFGIVYAITRYCNLMCKHCGVNARLFEMEKGQQRFETSFDDVCTIIERIREYVQANGLQPFLMFGGGEPTLRPDFKQILAYAAERLGPTNVGFCTNGTLWVAEDLAEVEKHVGLIEISIDGPEQYHNSWRNPSKLLRLGNVSLRVMSLVTESVRLDQLRQKLEISSIVTKDNLPLLPVLARDLREAGVKTYSVHRAMPVGRMARRLGQIPTPYDYIHFFITMARLRSEDWSFDLHLHHSLESIYSALLLGEDIHRSRLPMGSKRHSIGIDWNGSVHFDPWSLVAPFDRLSAGNLLHDTVDLRSLMEEPASIMHLAGDIVKKNVRCKQCAMSCTGGMRLNAISHYVHSSVGKSIRDIPDSYLVAGLSEIDPACPLYE